MASSFAALVMLFKGAQLAEGKLWNCSVPQVAFHLTALAGQLKSSNGATPPPSFWYWPSLLSRSFPFLSLLLPTCPSPPLPKAKSGEGRHVGGQPGCPLVSDKSAPVSCLPLPSKAQLMDLAGRHTSPFGHPSLSPTPQLFRPYFYANGFLLRENLALLSSGCYACRCVGLRRPVECDIWYSRQDGARCSLFRSLISS